MMESEVPDMIPSPDLQKHVFIKVKEDLGDIIIDEEEYVLALLNYATNSPFLTVALPSIYKRTIYMPFNIKRSWTNSCKIRSL